MSKAPTIAESDPLDAVFFALSDPSRRQMLARLSRGVANASELAQPLAMSKPAVSRHLRVLESAGLIERQRRGREHWFTLATGPLVDAGDYIARTRAFWEGTLDQLTDYLEASDGAP